MLAFTRYVMYTWCASIHQSFCHYFRPGDLQPLLPQTRALRGLVRAADPATRAAREDAPGARAAGGNARHLLLRYGSTLHLAPRTSHLAPPQIELRPLSDVSSPCQLTASSPHLLATVQGELLFRYNTAMVVSAGWEPGCWQWWPRVE